MPSAGASAAQDLAVRRRLHPLRQRYNRYSEPKANRTPTKIGTASPREGISNSTGEGDGEGEEDGEAEGNNSVDQFGKIGQIRPPNGGGGSWCSPHVSGKVPFCTSPHTRTHTRHMRTTLGENTSRITDTRVEWAPNVFLTGRAECCEVLASSAPTVCSKKGRQAVELERMFVNSDRPQISDRRLQFSCCWLWSNTSLQTGTGRGVQGGFGAG